MGTGSERCIKIKPGRREATNANSYVAAVWLTHNGAKVYVRDALSTLFVQSPISHRSVVTFDTIATVHDFYEVTALHALTV